MQVKPLIGHFIFWLTILLLGTATIYPYYLDIKTAIIDRIVFLPVWWIATYTSWLILIPKYLDVGKTKHYVFLLLMIILILTVAQRYLCLYVFYPIYM